MKIIHTADLHLGMENYGRHDPATGLSTRIHDFLAALDAVVDRAVDDGFDLFLFCGDAYKTRDPSPTLQREFAKRINRLVRGGVAVFLLAGNHDLPHAAGRASTFDIYQALHVPNVTVANRAGVSRIQTRSGLVQIVALPWVNRGVLLTQDEHRNKPMLEINNLLIERISARIEEMIGELDPTVPAIMAAHATLLGASLGGERNIMLGEDLMLPVSTLVRQPFVYVALGHIHRHQVVPGSVPAVYAGSLQRIDFGEEGEPKGYVVVEIRPSGRPEEADWSFVEVAARRFVTIEVNAKTEDPTATVVQAIERRADEVRDAVVRMIITIDEARAGLLREQEIRKALKEAAFIASIGRVVERNGPHPPVPPDVPIEQLTPLDALRVYLESKSTPPDRIETLIEYARRLIEEPAG